HFNMIDMRHRQRPLVRIKRLTWKATLQAALFASPTRLVFYLSRNLIPIFGILRAVHWHQNNSPCSHFFTASFTGGQTVSIFSTKSPRLIAAASAFSHWSIVAVGHALLCVADLIIAKHSSWRFIGRRSPR